MDRHRYRIVERPSGSPSVESVEQNERRYQVITDYEDGIIGPAS